MCLLTVHNKAINFVYIFSQKSRNSGDGSWSPENPIPGQGSGKASQDEEATGTFGDRPEKGCPSRTQGCVRRMQGRQLPRSPSL